MPGFSTKGSPKPLCGTVTKAGSVPGGKTTGWLCSVPGGGGALSLGTAHGPQALLPGARGTAQLPTRTGARGGVWWDAGARGTGGGGGPPRHAQLAQAANLLSSCTDTRPLTPAGPRLT